MSLFRGYQGATRCSDGPTPGARAFMAWFLAVYAGRGGKNLGIFNCRTVRGGTTTSLHGEGRACDLGINPHGAAYGAQLADQLRLNSGELGVQCIIWDRRIWSGAQPDAGWRRYGGVNPHVDHLHVELSRDTARTLTAARVGQILGGVTTPSVPGKDWFDMASEADLRRVITDVLRTSIPRGGDTQTGRTTSHYEVARWTDHAWELQRREIAALRAVVEQLAVAATGGGGATAAEVKRAVADAIREGLVHVDVRVGSPP